MFSTVFRVFICFLVGSLVTAAVSNHSNFQEVVENQPSKAIRKKLKKFWAGGIERPVDTKQYDAGLVIKSAFSHLATRHRMGGKSKKGIDCSGLVMVAHRSVGITLPHHSQEQARYGKIIPCKDSLQPGDMVFFQNSYKTQSLITHSGIYLGKGRFIHASHSCGVIVTELESSYYWRSRFLFGTRLCHN